MKQMRSAVLQSGQRSTFLLPHRIFLRSCCDPFSECLMCYYPHKEVCLTLLIDKLQCGAIAFSSSNLSAAYFVFASPKFQSVFYDMYGYCWETTLSRSFQERSGRDAACYRVRFWTKSFSGLGFQNWGFSLYFSFFWFQTLDFFCFKIVWISL